MNMGLARTEGKRRQRLALSVYLSCVLLAPGLSLAQEPPSGEDGVRKALLARLSASDEEQRLDAVTQLAGWFPSSSGEAGFEAVTALALAMRRDVSPVVRALAARALELSGDPRAAEALLSALADEREIAVRKAILYALARHGAARPSPQTVAALIPRLKDKKPEIRGAAAFALAEIRDRASAPALLDLLKKRGKDEDAFARAHAARALGAIGDRTALAPLLKSLATDKFPDVRREAAVALGRLALQSDVEVLAALREALRSPDPHLAAIAVASIEAANSRSQ
jgi:HEAT repeat protein